MNLFRLLWGGEPWIRRRAHVTRFSVATNSEPESVDYGSSDEFKILHYSRWPSMRTPV